MQLVRNHTHALKGNRPLEAIPILADADIPLAMYHGTADALAPFENAEKFFRIFKETKQRLRKPVRTMVWKPYPGQDHGFPFTDEVKFAKTTAAFIIQDTETDELLSTTQQQQRLQ